jgi:hypothetical protein
MYSIFEFNFSWLVLAIQSVFSLPMLLLQLLASWLVWLIFQLLTCVLLSVLLPFSVFLIVHGHE